MRKILALVVLLAPATVLAQTSTAYHEDSHHASGQYGTFVLGVRKDAGGSFVDADGDYAPLQLDANGMFRAIVAQSGAWTVTGNQGTAAAHANRWPMGLSDGSGFISPATDRTTAAAPFSFRLSDGGAFYDATKTGQLPTALDGSGFLKVHEQGTHAVTGSGTFTVDSELPAAAALADNTANPTAPAVGAFLEAWDGTNWDRLQTGAASGGALKVDGSAITQPVSGTFWQATQPVSGTVTANAGTNLNTSALALDTTLAGVIKAEDTAHSTGHNGIMALAVREATATDLSAGGTDGDYEPLQVDATGRLHVNPGTVTVTQPTASSLNAEVQGDAASDAPVSGNPVLVGGRASAAAPADVSADGDAVSGWRLRNGAAATVITAAGALVGGDAANGIDVDVTRVTGTVAVAGTGTAGAPAGNILTVQGVASMTKLLVTPDPVALPANQSVNLAQVAGATTLTGNGTAAGAIRVTQASDSTGQMKITDGTDTAQVTATAGGSMQVECVSGCGGSGGTSAADGAAYVASTTQGTPVMGAFDDASPGTVAEDKVGIARITTNRALHVNLRDASGNELSVGGGTQYDEDTASGAADKVMMAGAVRKDTAATLVDTDGDRTELQTDSSGRLRVTAADATQPVSGTVTANAGSGTFTVDSELPAAAALADNTANPTAPAVGAFLEAWDGTNWDRLQTGAASGGALKVDGSAITQPVSGTVAVSGSVTVTDGAGGLNVIVDSGSITANAGTNLNTSALALESGGNLATVSALSRAEDSAHSTGHTGVMALAVREATATDLSAGATDGDYEPLQVDASGRLHVQTGTVTVTGTVTTTPPSNASTNVAQVGGASTATAASGVQKVGVVGNAGATLDAVVGAATAPTNQVVTGSVYNTTAPAPTNGQSMAVQADQAGNERIFPGIALTTLSGWTSGTSVNATQTIFSNSGAKSVLVHLVQTSTISGGAITFEVSYDNTNWVTVPADAVLDPSSSMAQITLPYTLVASTNKPFMVSNKGWQGLRIKLSTAITGSATVTPNYALLPYEPNDAVIAQGIAAHDAVVAGNPVLIAGYAETAEDSDGNTNANRTSADGDATRLLTDRNGALFVRNGPPHRWSYHENSSSALTDTTVHGSCGTGLYNYIESVTFSNGAATALNLFIEDSTATTILGPFYLEAVNGRGANILFPGGKKQTTSATLISVTTSDAHAHSVDVTGFCAP
jgi:hypothetical protein